MKKNFDLWDFFFLSTEEKEREEYYESNFSELIRT